MLKRIFKIVLKCIGVLLLFIAVYLLSTFILSSVTVDADTTEVSDTVNIYILTNGVHSDLVLPTLNSQMNWFEKLSFFRRKKQSFSI